MPLLTWQGHAGVGTGSFDMVLFICPLFIQPWNSDPQNSIKIIGKTTLPHHLTCMDIYYLIF